MAQLSELVSILRKNRAPSNMKSPGQMTQRGVARGAAGSSGSVTLQWRNPDAGADKEREMMESPIFKALMEEFAPKTPVTDYLRGLM